MQSYHVELFCSGCGDLMSSKTYVADEQRVEPDRFCAVCNEEDEPKKPKKPKKPKHSKAELVTMADEAGVELTPKMSKDEILKELIDAGILEGETNG